MYGEFRVAPRLNKLHLQSFIKKTTGLQFISHREYHWFTPPLSKRVIVGKKPCGRKSKAIDTKP